MRFPLISPPLFLTALLCLPIAAGAQQQARITQLEGSAVIVRQDSGEEKLEIVEGEIRNGFVSPGDMIRTEAGSRVVLRFDDDSRIEIGESSEFVVKGEEPAIGERLKKLYELLRGHISASISPDDDYDIEIETPSAVAATKGTVFRLLVSPETGTTLSVSEGLVELTNPTFELTAVFGPGESVTYLEEEQRLTVSIPEKVPEAVDFDLVDSVIIAPSGAVFVLRMGQDNKLVVVSSESGQIRIVDPDGTEVVLEEGKQVAVPVEKEKAKKAEARSDTIECRDTNTCSRGVCCNGICCAAGETCCGGLCCPGRHCCHDQCNPSSVCID